jgi:ribulose-phosphate 3-epimerase
MFEIIPAILVKKFDDLKDTLSKLVGVVHTVQVDFCDGVFVPSKTWPYADGVDEEGNILDHNFNKIINEEEGMPFWNEFEFELHLMVQNAHKDFGTFLKLGPKAVLFQLEAEGDVTLFKEFLEGIDPYVRDHVEIGLSINIDTPLEVVYPLVPLLSFIQVMGIAKIGYQGQGFDDRSLEKIKTLREKYPDLIIIVDGSVNLETAPRIIKAGATKLVVGSALWKDDDPAGAIFEMQQEIIK